jgi:hypothetical protein
LIAMNTSRTRGRRWATSATARTAVGASNQGQTPPFQSSTSSPSVIPSNRSHGGGPGCGGSDGSPNGTASIDERRLGSSG